MSESRNNEEILYKLSPRFNLLYELFMPTGRKIKSTLIILILMCVATILFISNASNLDIADIMIFNNLSMSNFLSSFLTIVNIILVLKLVIHIIFQIMQYKHITYTFYNSHMVYEDDFLNQHRKNIEYSNIKEVEIRRTILDRILGYGVIVIYTNAENIRNNGLVIYAIKNPKYSYDAIDKIIHRTNNEKKLEVPAETKENYTIDNSKNVVENANIENENNNSNSNVDNNQNDEYSSEIQRQKRILENKKEEAEFLDSLKDVNSVENVNIDTIDE